MESSEGNVCRVDSSPYPRLSYTPSDTSKLCVHESHDPIVNFSQQFVLTHTVEHSQETLGLVYLRNWRTDGDLSTAINEGFDRNIVANDVDVQHCDRSKAFWIILIRHLQILPHSLLSIYNQLLNSKTWCAYRIISSITICASAE